MHTWQATPIRDAIIRALQSHGPMTYDQLADKLQFPVLTVKRSIASARKATSSKQIRIASWKRQPRHLLPVFGAGDGKKDAQKPKALTNNEKNKLYRKRGAQKEAIRTHWDTSMSAYIRWRCERIDQLFAEGVPRLEALATIRQEELLHPWERDPRPAPPPMPMGDAYYGLNPQHLQPA